MTPRFKGRPRKRKRPLGPSSAGNVDDADDADIIPADAVANDSLKRRNSNNKTSPTTVLGAGNRKRKSGVGVSAGVNNSAADDKKPFFCEKRGCFVYSGEGTPPPQTTTTTTPASAGTAERKSTTPPEDENDTCAGGGGGGAAAAAAAATAAVKEEAAGSEGGTEAETGSGTGLKTTPNGAKKKKVTDASTTKVKKEIKDENGGEKEKEVKVKKVRDEFAVYLIVTTLKLFFTLSV